MNHLHLELINVTENSAIAASAYVGRGDKIAADLAATTAMKERLNTIDFYGVVVIGEGKKDNAPPGLFAGDEVGKGSISCITGRPPPQYDIAVDPIEGTTPTSKGGNEAISVIALGDRHCLFSSETFYMNKLAVGPDIAGYDINVTDPIHRIVEQVCLATHKSSDKVTFCVLDRPRHSKLINDIRKHGCRIRLISDCDVSGAIATCIPESGIDVYMGIGGTPEGVISAVALKCMRGNFQGILCDKDGNSVDGKVHKMENLAKGDVVFCATGITSGSLLNGVRYPNGKPHTHSILMRSESGTVRKIETQHGN